MCVDDQINYVLIRPQICRLLFIATNVFSYLVIATSVL